MEPKPWSRVEESRQGQVLKVAIDFAIQAGLTDEFNQSDRGNGKPVIPERPENFVFLEIEKMSLTILASDQAGMIRRKPRR